MDAGIAASLGAWVLTFGACAHRAHAPQGNGAVITQIAAGVSSACARRSDGAVLCWGQCGPACNGHVPEGSSDDAPSAPPAMVPGVDHAVAVAVGERSACAVRVDGSVWCWGDNFDATFGRADPEESAAPVAVPGVANVAEIAAARSMMCARRRDGTVVAWGGRLQGADRNPTQQGHLVPTTIVDVAGAEALFRRGDGCCARLAAGGVRCWSGGLVETNYHSDFGYTHATQVGDAHTRAVGDCDCRVDDHAVLTCNSLAFPGAMTSEGTVPPSVPNGCSMRHLEGVASVAAELVAACAVRTDGRVVCWGPGETRQTVSLDARVRQLVVSESGTTYALDENGVVWGWSRFARENAIPGRAGVVEAPARVLP